MERKIDKVLEDWSEDKNHKALVLRGPRQVGKSYAIRNKRFTVGTTIPI